MAFNLDPKTTALVLIDLQKGIVARPLAPHNGEKVVQNSVALGKRFAELKATLALVHVAFSADNGDLLTQPTDAPMQMPPGGFPRDFSDFAPEIAALPAQIIITKRQWGAFHGTELDLQLRRRKINTIVLAGIATNIGVESTAREAYQHNYSVVIAEDACSTMTQEMQQFAMKTIFPRLARVRSTAEILAALV